MDEFIPDETNDFEQEFAKWVKKSQELAIPRDGDYIDDEGFLCCGKCKTRKERKINLTSFANTYIRVGTYCNCERKKMEDMERHLAENVLNDRREEAVSNGWIQRGYLLNRFERDKDPTSDISKSLREYVKNFDDMLQKNIGITLSGDVGVGKTFYATCVANAVFDAGHNVLIDTYANLCNRIQDFGNERDFVMWCIRNAALVVIDDFGAERSSDYVQEKGFTLIDERVKSKAPLIITTNLRPDSPETTLQQRRIFSRLREACPVQLEVKHGTRGREEIGKSKRDYFKKVCGGAV